VTATLKIPRCVKFFSSQYAGVQNPSVTRPDPERPIQVAHIVVESPPSTDRPETQSVVAGPTCRQAVHLSDPTPAPQPRISAGWWTTGLAGSSPVSVTRRPGRRRLPSADIDTQHGTRVVTVSRLARRVAGCCGGKPFRQSTASLPTTKSQNKTRRTFNGNNRHGQTHRTKSKPPSLSHRPSTGQC